jgi:ketosteroid isomerase-like protein
MRSIPPGVAQDSLPRRHRIRASRVPPFTGRDRVLQFYKSERIIASGKHHLGQIVVDDKSGACWGHFVGTLKSGQKVDERFADVYSYEDGKIKARSSYFFRPAV